MLVELSKKQLLIIDNCLTTTTDDAADSYVMTEEEKIELYEDIDSVFSAIKDYLN
jgi:hypothetical protein